MVRVVVAVILALISWQGNASKISRGNLNIALGSIKKKISALAVGAAFYCGPARAEEAVQSLQSADVSGPRVTSRAYLDVSIARGPTKRIALDIYGNEAPQASKFFLSVCKGDYGEGVSYDGSQVSKIQKDRIISVAKLAKGGGLKQETWMDNVGKVRIRSVNLAEKATHSDANALRHDTPGVLSVPKGGKTFEFSIAPRPNPELDEKNVVIGRVSGDDSLKVVSEINAVPVSREDILGTKGGFSSVGKAFDPRAKIASVDRPLKTIKVLQCQVDPQSSVASFLKF